MKPLDGVTVLDLTPYLPGPYASQLLADMGARVIKVESRTGDPARHLPPQIKGVGAFFGAINQGKRSIVIDLKKNGGPELLLRLAEKADLLMEGFRPGVLARLGVGAEALRARNPRLVIASLSGYGVSGPDVQLPGHDINYLGYAGALSLFAEADGRPVLPGVQVADSVGGLQFALACVAGLYRAEKSGQGCLIATSMFEASLSLISVYMGMVMGGEAIKPGAMLLSGALPVYGLYRAGDQRWVTLGALEPKFWQRFCELVEKPEWAARYADPELSADLSAMFSTRDAADWVALLGKEACVGPVLSLAEALEHPQARELGMVGERRIQAPWTFDGERPRAEDSLSPRPGSEGPALLGELLGCDEAAIEALREQGALG